MKGEKYARAHNLFDLAHVMARVARERYDGAGIFFIYLFFFIIIIQYLWRTHNDVAENENERENKGELPRNTPFRRHRIVNVYFYFFLLHFAVLFIVV